MTDTLNIEVRGEFPKNIKIPNGENGNFDPPFEEYKQKYNEEFNPSTNNYLEQTWEKLVQQEPIEPGTEIEIDNEHHAEITEEGTYPGDAGGLPFIRIAINISTGITSGIIATWLYNLATRNDCKVHIGTVEITEDEFNENTSTDSAMNRRNRTEDGLETEVYWQRKIVIDGDEEDVETVQKKLEEYYDKKQ